MKKHKFGLRTKNQKLNGWLKRFNYMRCFRPFKISFFNFLKSSLTLPWITTLSLIQGRVREHLLKPWREKHFLEETEQSMLLPKGPCPLKIPIPWFFSDIHTDQNKSIKEFPLTFLKANCSNTCVKIVYCTIHSFEGHCILFDYYLIRERVTSFSISHCRKTL